MAIRSAADGKNIEIDGAFVGSTTTVQLQPGSHTVVVMKDSQVLSAPKINATGSDFCRIKRDSSIPL
jgi:hypothetical protein